MKSFTDPSALLYCAPTLPGDTGEERRTVEAEIQRRVQERTARLQAQVKEMETFSYSISHDLRAPLRSIGGFARMLTEDHGAKLDDEGRRMLGIISEEGRRMGQLIDDFLTFSGIGRQPIDLSTIDMTDLASSAFQQIVEAAPKHVPALELRRLPPARGDRAMMRQVFANLLSNAIKFTSKREGARVEVSGCTVGDWNTYCVTDNGAGFDPRYAHKLFGVFQRLHNQDEFEGTGVGLAIVQNIVQRHGGKVWAEGKPNAGAKFYFTLPNHSTHQS
jgi:light-regulated signal transduction histidine kinase (bacteriophytochrome)